MERQACTHTQWDERSRRRRWKTKTELSKKPTLFCSFEAPVIFHFLESVVNVSPYRRSSRKLPRARFRPHPQNSRGTVPAPAPLASSELEGRRRAGNLRRGRRHWEKYSGTGTARGVRRRKAGKAKQAGLRTTLSTASQVCQGQRAGLTGTEKSPHPQGT